MFDGDTSITSDTDDQIDIKIGGSDKVTMIVVEMWVLGQVRLVWLAHVYNEYQTSIPDR